MHLHFDPTFSAGAFPGPWGVPDAAAGTSWLGEAGLLGWLETHLGVPYPKRSSTERVANLAARLLQTEGFWSASAKADPLSVAHVLVELDDELGLSGWNREPVAPRLAALAEVLEPRGHRVADRLQVLSSVVRHRVVDRLTLYSPRESFPRRWQELFTALERSGSELTIATTPKSAGTSDLARSRGADLFAPKGDGSLQLIRPPGPLAAADAIAVALASSPDVPTAIIGADRVLDDALRRHGLPTGGAPGDSSDNALLELVPLVVALGHAPPDPHRVLELLTLAVSPIPAPIARDLASALQEAPAVDSDAWREALADGLAELEARDGSERAAKVKERLTTLFTSSPGTDVALPALRSRMAVLRQWLIGRRKKEEQDAHEASVEHLDGALALVAEFESLLAPFGAGPLSWNLVSRLLEEARGSASSPSFHPAEAGFPSIGHPGGLHGPVSRVVWWNFTRGASSGSRRSLLTKDELAALKAAGVAVESPADRARREAALWRRPLEWTTDALWFVCPASDAAGEEAEPHPLWDEVVARFKEGRQVASVTFSEPKLERAPKRVQRSGLSLPVARTEWTAPAPLALRAKESPSSVETLTGCSFKWALQYPGRLGHGQTASLPDGDQLVGSLAHALLEGVLNRGVKEENEARRVAEALFEAEAPRLAAKLFVPGFDRERAAARRAVSDSAAALAALVRNGWKAKHVEQELTGVLEGTGFAGRPDVVFEKSGTPAVVDLKWSGRSYRWNLLTGGGALQLASYAELLRQNGAAAPVVAYFIIREQKLLTGAQVLAQHSVGPANAVEPAETFAALTRAVRSAKAKLAAGRLTATGTTDDPPKATGLTDEGELAVAAPCGFCEFGGVCGTKYQEGGTHG